MDLSKQKLPHTIKVNGETYKIKTDFRFFLLLSKKLKTISIGKKLKYEDLDFMYEGKCPPDRKKGFEGLLAFMNPAQEIPRNIMGAVSDVITFDYDIDADLIYAAFMQQYKIDLFDIDYLHWWKFRALFSGLRDTKLTDIFGYRLWKDNNKQDEYSKSQRELKRMWEIIPPQTKEEKEQEEKTTKRFDDFLAGKL